MRRQRTVPVWLTSLAFVFGAALGCSTPGAVTPTEFVMVPGGTEQSLTNTAAPSPPPAPSATISPSPLPPATPFDPSSLSPQVRPILDFYPLAPGAVWTYLATFDMSTGPGPDNATHWAGPITAAVTEGAVEQGFPVFRLDWSGYPDFAAPEFEAEYYVVLSTGIYRAASREEGVEFARAGAAKYSADLAWPLTVGGQWGEPDMLAHKDGRYVWVIESTEAVNVPAGSLDNCYRAAFHTNPDTTLRWLCPGQGLARFEYHHHGSVNDQVWELAEFTPGS